MRITMNHTQHRRSKSRPWYVRGKSVDEYCRAINNNEDTDTPTMKRQLTMIRSIIVNLGIIGLSAYGLSLGGDVTLITTFALAVLAGYNGIEISEMGAFLQAYQEVNSGGNNNNSIDGSANNNNNNTDGSSE